MSVRLGDVETEFNLSLYHVEELLKKLSIRDVNGCITESDLNRIRQQLNGGESGTNMWDKPLGRIEEEPDTDVEFSTQNGTTIPDHLIDEYSSVFAAVNPSNSPEVSVQQTDKTLGSKLVTYSRSSSVDFDGFVKLASDPETCIESEPPNSPLHSMSETTDSLGPGAVFPSQARPQAMEGPRPHLIERPLTVQREREAKTARLRSRLPGLYDEFDRLFRTLDRDGVGYVAGKVMDEELEVSWFREWSQEHKDVTFTDFLLVMVDRRANGEFSPALENTSLSRKRNVSFPPRNPYKLSRVCQSYQSTAPTNIPPAPRRTRGLSDPPSRPQSRLPAPSVVTRHRSHSASSGPRTNPPLPKGMGAAVLRNLGSRDRVLPPRPAVPRRPPRVSSTRRGVRQANIPTTLRDRNHHQQQQQQQEEQQKRGEQAAGRDAAMPVPRLPPQHTRRQAEEFMQALPDKLRDEYLSIFHILAKNRKDRVSTLELANGLGISYQEGKKLVRGGDTNGDMMLDSTEFIAVMGGSPVFEDVVGRCNQENAAQQRDLQVAVPGGLRPGDVFLVKGPNGKRIEAVVPAGARPGAKLAVPLSYFY